MSSLPRLQSFRRLGLLWGWTRHAKPLTAGFGLALLVQDSQLHQVDSRLVAAVIAFPVGVLMERTLATAHAPADRRALIAYLPIGAAGIADFLSKGTTAQVLLNHGSLTGFYDAAASLLGLLLVSVMLEARRQAAHDAWLRVLRGWWVLFIVIGILYALVGLTPDQSAKMQEASYTLVWAGLAGAVTAFVVVAWMDQPQRA